MDSVQRQLEKLSMEAKDVASDLKLARAALRKEPGNKLLREEVDDLRVKENDLTQMRKALVARLSGGIPGLGADLGGLAAAKSVETKQLAAVKAWAETVAETAKLLHATEAELETMSVADRQAAHDMRAQRFIPFIPRLRRLSNILPLVLTGSFYDRSVYDEFLKLIDTLDAGNSNNWALIITGDPGIGKSTFALRLILKLAAQHKKMVYEYIRDALDDSGLVQIYVDFSDLADIQVDVATDPAGKKRFEGYRDDPQVYRLLDGKTPSGQYSGNMRTVVFTSPDAKKWNEFTKTSRSTCDMKVSATVAWMPWWSADELVHAAVRLDIISLEQRQQIEDRFKDLGGIARRVLGSSQPSHVILEELEDSLSFALAKQLVRCYEEGTLAEISHRYVHAVVTDDFKFQCWELASDSIAEMVHNKFSQLHWQELSDLLENHGGNPKASQMLGQMFEQRAHVLGELGVLPTLGITLAADSVGYLARTDAPAAATPSQHPYSRYCNTISVPTAVGSDQAVNMQAMAAPTHSSAAANNSPQAAMATSSSATSSSCANSNNAAANSGSTSAPAASPSLKQQKGRRKSQPPSIDSVCRDLSTQEQGTFCARIAEAYNRPHQRQLDVGGKLYSGMYLQPVHPTQGAWDAVMWDDEVGFLIVQHTSNVKHGLILKFIEELLGRIKQADPMRKHPVHIVFAVPQQPPDVFTHYRAQKFSSDQDGTMPWESVPQEVLDIPMWKLKLPMTPASKVAAISRLIKAVEQRTKERLEVMKICSMTLSELKEQLKRLGKVTVGNKDQLMCRLLWAKSLLPDGIDVVAHGSSSSSAGLDIEVNSEASKVD